MPTTVRSALSFATKSDGEIVVVSSVNARELFKYVSLQISVYWDLLLWMDAANFGGITCANPLVESTAEGREIDMNWNIATFLPNAVRPSFQESIANFMHGMHMCKVEATRSQRTPLRVLQNGSQTQPDQTRKEEVDSAKAYIGHKLTRQLLRTVQDLQRQHADDAPDAERRAEWAFPHLPGSHLNLQNPVLEAIKFICAILALSRDVSAEVGILRRNLLDLVGVRE